MIAASIQAVFGADTATLAKGSADAEGIVAGFASKASAALGALGIGLGAGAILGFFKTVIDKGGALQDLSERLDVSTDALQSFDFAVRQAGGTTEQANDVWDKSRKALDSLNAGQEAAVKQFAAIGLSAADFIGLDLPQSLEKITRGYADNADRAGAYDAITDILGSKTAPALNTVLLKLASEGFPAFTAAAKEAGQVIEKETIARMDEFGDRVDSLKGRLTTWGATAFNILGRVTDGLGALGAMALNAFDGVETSINRTDFAAEKADTAIKKILPALTETTEQLKAQKDIQTERAKYDELIAKAALDQLEPTAKITELKRRLGELAADSLMAAGGELEFQKALVKQAELVTDIRKLEAAETKKAADALRLGKEQELEYAKLVIKEAKGLTSEEQLRLSVLRLQQAEQKNEYEIKEVLAKGVKNLTAADKERLTELFKQKTLLEAQKTEATGLITLATTNAKSQEEVTAALDAQLKKAKEIKEAADAASRSWDNYYIAVQRTGKGYSSQSTTALEGVRDRLQAQLAAPSPNTGRAVKDANMGQDYGAWLMAATYTAELSSVMRELDQRKSVASYAQRYGESAAIYKFGDDLTNRALADLNSTQQRTTSAVEDIALRLKKIL